MAEEANGLQLQLDHPLPAEVEVGAGTAVFVCGWCFNRDAKVRSLGLRVDGSPQPLMAYGMPRSDVFTVLHPAIDSADSAQLTSDPDSPSDPQLLSFRSGFWGLARIGPREPGNDCRLELRAELEGGGAALTELGRLADRRAPGRARGARRARAGRRPAGRDMHGHP